MNTSLGGTIMSTSGLHETVGISLERSTEIIDLFYDHFLEGYRNDPDPLVFTSDALHWILHEPTLSTGEMVYLTYFFTRIILLDAGEGADAKASGH